MLDRSIHAWPHKGGQTQALEGSHPQDYALTCDSMWNIGQEELGRAWRCDESLLGTRPFIPMPVPSACGGDMPLPLHHAR